MKCFRSQTTSQKLLIVIMATLGLYGTFYHRLPSTNHYLTREKANLPVDAGGVRNDGSMFVLRRYGFQNRSKKATKMTTTSLQHFHPKRTLQNDVRNNSFDSFQGANEANVLLQNVQRSRKATLQELYKTKDNVNIQMNNISLKLNYFTLHKTKINPIETDFIIEGSPICDSIHEDQYMTLLILVPTLPSRYRIRDAIRNTYGSYSKQVFTIQNSNITVTVRLAFLMGREKGSKSDTLIRSESEKYGDIIYANFDDTYRNLTRKMLIGLKWVSEYCRDLNFLLKIDDDMFINIPLLVSELHKQPYDNKGSVYGNLHVNSPVLRNGKWAVTKEDYPMPTYPIYACGGSYVISGNIIPKMVYISGYLKHIEIEDVFITGCIVKMIGAKLVQLPKLIKSYYERSSPCRFMGGKFISTTNVNTSKMFWFWKISINYEHYCTRHKQ